MDDKHTNDFCTKGKHTDAKHTEDETCWWHTDDILKTNIPKTFHTWYLCPTWGSGHHLYKILDILVPMSLESHSVQLEQLRFDSWWHADEGGSNQALGVWNYCKHTVTNVSWQTSSDKLIPTTYSDKSFLGLPILSWVLKDKLSNKMVN